MGFGPEMTDDDFTAAGRAEFARFIIDRLKCSRKATDPETVVRELQGRPGIDQETRRVVLTTLFPPRARHARPALVSVAAARA
jgi:hypothetical protein